jgi:glycosyltransferase involved in cell wall biosynthesis
VNAVSDLVSILIPAYNAEKWIKETIRSASEQTWPNKEIIIVDDGSTDSTLRIAKESESPLVKVITQENKGASAARNKALSIAQGDYIQWLDADDLLAPDKISQQLLHVDHGRNDRILYSGSWGRFFYRIDKAQFIPNSLWQDMEPAEWILRKLDNNAWMGIESWLISRKLTELAGPWDERLSVDDDGEYFCRVVSASEKIRFIPEARCYCRTWTSGSMSSHFETSDKKMESQFLSISLHIGYLMALENSERARAACLKYLQRWFIYFYPEYRGIVGRAEQLARSLGGELSIPSLGWKYALIRNTLGWAMAKKMRRVAPKVKLLARINWDKVLDKLEVG